MRATVLVAGVLAGCGSLPGGDVFATRPPLSTTDAGTPCTPKSLRDDWPVKVVFVMQNSGAMCVADPPGSSGTSGFCEQITGPSGVAMPARVRAVQAFINANRDRTNVSVALVTWGLESSVVPFTTAAMLEPRLSRLQSELAGASNLQGALVATKRLVEGDVLQTAESLRARSRYVVVVLSTGVPFPRCAADDELPIYANAGTPELVWADSPGAASWCSNPQPEPLGFEFVAKGDLNQNTQLRQAAANIVALDSVYGLGDVRVHTRLVLSAQAVTQCGAICQDVFGGLSVAEARAVGTYTLGQLSQYGQGSFVDPGEPSGLEATMSSIDTAEFTTFCE